MVRAMTLLHDRATEGLEVAEIVKHLDTDRKTLDARFKDLIGRTPQEEINRRRLDHLRDLLMQTDLTVSEIAARCGFKTDTALITFFKSGFGSTPNDYRLQHA